MCMSTNQVYAILKCFKLDLPGSEIKLLMPPREALQQAPQEYCLAFRAPRCRKHELSCNKQRKASKMNSEKGEVIVRILKGLFLFSKIKAKRKDVLRGEEN